MAFFGRYYPCDQKQYSTTAPFDIQTRDDRTSGFLDWKQSFLGVKAVVRTIDLGAKYVGGMKAAGLERFGNLYVELSYDDNYCSPRANPNIAKMEFKTPCLVCCYFGSLDEEGELDRLILVEDYRKVVCTDTLDAYLSRTELIDVTKFPFELDEKALVEAAMLTAPENA